MHCCQMRTLVAVSLLAAGASAAGGIVHIDLKRGSDRSSKADGSAQRPFRTLGGWAARGGATSGAAGIHFGPGMHDLVSAGGLKLDTAGDAAAPFTVTGEGPGLTQLSAGVQVHGFAERSVQGDGAGRAVRQWHATMPANTTYFRQLFVRSSTSGNFSRRLTARSETMTYDHTNMKNPQFAIVYKEGQVMASYHNQEDVLATLYHCWTATTHRINNINASNSTLTLFQSPHVNIPRCEHASGKRFLIEDAREELDEPGEFYYDRGTRELIYLPLPEENLADGKFEAWAPQLIAPILVTANHVKLAGLSVLHAAADMDGFFVGDCDGQSASNLHSGAVVLNGSSASQVTVNNVEVAHTGGFGVVTRGAVRDVMLSRLHIHDVGAGGVSVEKPAETTDGSAVHNFSLVDSVIHDGGHVYKMGPGVMLQNCRGCAVDHNRIHDFFYTGVTTGIGFNSEMIRDTTLSFNEIHTLGQGQLSDMGCVYVWGGNQSGLLVNNNLCHNVSSFSYGGWGLYNDQTTTSVTHTNNIIYDTEDACYHDHEGYNVTLRNNIFVKLGKTAAPHSDGTLRSATPTSTWHAAFNMHGNIITSTGPAPLFTAGSDLQWALSTFDDNVYWVDGDATDSKLFP